MEFSLILVIVIFLASIICEFINASLGMLYGTILSPMLIIVGFEPILVIPSILFSQAIGGFTASIMHHRLKNADFRLRSTNLKYITEKLIKLGYRESFNLGITQDLKVSIYIIVFGIIAVVLAALIAINIPEIALKTYIGLLVLVMGIVLLSKAKFIFSWKKIIGIGIISAFNKTISGGGFGPVVTTGQLIGGRDSKGSVGSTILAEAPICIMGFGIYFFTKGIANWNLLLILAAGALIGALIGPFFTAKFKSNKILKLVLGILVTVLGIFILLNTWFLNIKGI